MDFERKLTRDDWMRLRGAAMSSNKSIATRAKMALGEFATKHPDGNYRQAAKLMLWSAANPGKPYPEARSPQESTEYADPGQRAMESAARQGGVVQQEGATSVRSPRSPILELLAKSARENSAATAETQRDKSYYPKEFSPFWRRQALYNVATAPTLGKNVLPALADKITGGNEYSDASMAEARDVAPLSLGEDLVTSMAGGYPLGRALSFLRPPLAQGRWWCSAAKGAGVDAAAVHGLNVASGAAEGALSPTGTAGAGAAQAAREPLPAFLAALTGAAGGAGRTLENANPSANYLRSRGAKVNMGTPGKGPIFEGEIGKAGIGPNGKVVPESLNAAKQRAAQQLVKMFEGADKAAMDAREAALKGAADPLVTVTKPFRTAEAESTRAVNTGATKNAIEREILQDFLSRPEEPGLAQKVSVVPADGPPMTYAEAMKPRVSETSPLLDEYGTPVSKTEAARARGILPTDQVRMPSSVADQIRSKADEPANWASKDGGEPVFRSIANEFREANADTPIGRANQAQAEAMARIENAKAATGFSGKNMQSDVQPGTPAERRAVENALGNIARDLPITGEGQFSPELTRAIGDFPSLRAPIEELAALHARERLQLQPPLLYPRGSTTGSLGITALPRTGAEGWGVRVVSPILKLLSEAEAPALTAGPAYSRNKKYAAERKKKR